MTKSLVRVKNSRITYAYQPLSPILTTENRIQGHTEGCIAKGHIEEHTEGRTEGHTKGHTGGHRGGRAMGGRHGRIHEKTHRGIYVEGHKEGYTRRDMWGDTHEGT